MANSLTLKLMAAAAALVLGGAANAAVCSNSDVTYGTTTGSTTYDANACTNVSGNDDATEINAIGGAFGTGWLFAARDNNEGADASNTLSLFGGMFTFTLTAAAGQSGDYTLTVVDTQPGTAPDLPIQLDFVFTIKGGNDYAAYFFNDMTADGLDGGTWSVTFTNNGGQIPALSHMSVYTREGASSGGASSSSSSSSGQMPEPSSAALALLGLGLVGSGFLFRRKQKAS